MSKVKDVFRVAGKRGDLGVEIELEGRGVYDIGHVDGWLRDEDGSLRDEAYEYVLANPVKLDKLPECIDALNEAIDVAGARIYDTGRAGVHVHVNVQQLTMTQVYNMIVLYLIFEDQLIDLCGEYRDGNLFCLRASDAEYMIDFLAATAKQQAWYDLGSDNVRYAALNVNAIARYGSLEFRAMRSTTCKDTLMSWAGILLELRRLACEFENPIAIIEAFSRETPRRMYDRLFADYPNLVPFDRQSMMDGMRRAQIIAFSSDWIVVDYFSEFKKRYDKLDVKRMEAYYAGGAALLKDARENRQLYMQDRPFYDRLVGDMEEDPEQGEEQPEPEPAELDRIRELAEILEGQPVRQPVFRRAEDLMIDLDQWELNLDEPI